MNINGRAEDVTLTRLPGFLMERCGSITGIRRRGGGESGQHSPFSVQSTPEPYGDPLPPSLSFSSLSPSNMTSRAR